MNETRRNEKYLPDVWLPEQVTVYAQFEPVLNGSRFVVLALPTASIREVLGSMKRYINEPKIIVHAAKGLEPETHLRVSEMIEEELSPSIMKGIVALSGPSHAEEVGRRSPTTVVSSSRNIVLAEQVQDLFMNENFRVYTHTDLIGVELGGALKNIIALGAGLSDGLGFGDNAKAALMTRGLSEISRLGVRLGAHPLTFSGLTGLGDLVVTCTSKHSRNWRCGYEIGQGRALADVLQDMGMVVEGVRTTKAAFELSREKAVSMPITRELYAVLFEDKPAPQAVADLMRRSKTHEMESNLLGFFDVR